MDENDLYPVEDGQTLNSYILLWSENIGSPIHIGCGLLVILSGKVLELHLSPSSWWIWVYCRLFWGWVSFSGINPKIMKRFFRYYIIIFSIYMLKSTFILQVYHPCLKCHQESHISCKNHFSFSRFVVYVSHPSNSIFIMTIISEIEPFFNSRHVTRGYPSLLSRISLTK